jgi:hypothetical protein
MNAPFDRLRANGLESIFKETTLPATLPPVIASAAKQSLRFALLQHHTTPPRLLRHFVPRNDILIFLSLRAQRSNLFVLPYFTTTPPPRLVRRPDWSGLLAMTF